MISVSCVQFRAITDRNSRAVTLSLSYVIHVHAPAIGYDWLLM